MQEDLLHFIWRLNKLPTDGLYTVNREQVVILSPGTPNHLAGPDFFNASLELDGQLWAGNVEMHLKSSDWYAHHHETDENYNNVVLHVVWKDDVAVFRKDGSQIPTLELSNYVSTALLEQYQQLMEKSKRTFINCEKDFKHIDAFLVENWLHRLYIERLEQKSNLIMDLLRQSQNDWEAVLFVLLAKSFGSKVNGAYFLDRAKTLDFSVVRKVSQDAHQLESLFFGHFGLLADVDCSDAYFISLRTEYEYLTAKFGLPTCSGKPEFFGLRPANFPTIRLAQLAKLYARDAQLFSKLMQATTVEELHKVLEVGVGSYWETHFTFGKASRQTKKMLSKTFMDLLIINTIVPLRFCYAKHLDRDWNEDLIGLVSNLAPEANSILKNFEKIGSKTKNAMESQAKLELFNNYCSKNKCLRCAMGVHLLNRNT